MNTENETQEKQMTAEEALSTLQLAYKAFDKCSASRTFFTKGREVLNDPAFNMRGFYERYKTNGYNYINKIMANPLHDDNAVNTYGLDNVILFLNALNEEITARPDLDDMVSQMQEEEQVEVQRPHMEKPAPVEPEKTPLRQMAEFGQKPEPVPVTVAPPAPVEVPVIDQPQYGLLVNVDAIIRQTAINYLTSETSPILEHVEGKMKSVLLNNTLVILPDMKVEQTKTVIVSGRLHSSFAEAMEVIELEHQAFFAGPTGSGKTTLAEQIAEAKSLPFAHISVTAGMSEAHLLGRMIADGSYISTPLVELYENGGVFLADEIDAADPNTSLILNSALANGILSVPNRKEKPYAKRHPDFYFIGAANTWGNGSTEYSGRQKQDGAFMDRFSMSKVPVDYDTDLEADILKINPAFAKKLWQIRDAIKTQQVKKHLSTRVFAAAARGFARGYTEDKLLKRFFIGWTDNEREKVLS